MDQQKNSDLQYIEKLAVAISETLVDIQEHSNDPLDEYILTLRTHFFSNTKEFNKRFCRGYQILFNQIDS